MDDIQGIGAYLFGLYMLGMLAEAVKALIWGVIVGMCLKRALRS